MGLVVVGLGLLDISFWYLLLNAVVPEDALTPTNKLCVITTTMLTFGMGASTQALFARVGGGIYTKAADVGADLVGKVEAGIPEDDPRNPATIADNVGDNVGDVAGMGADLYESYCGSILSTAALGAAAFLHSGDTAMQFKAVIAPMLIAAVGILLSIAGIFAVRTRENASMKDLLKALGLGTNLSSALIVVATFLILWGLGLENWRTDAFFTALHLRYLERTYWQTRYSISLPRLRPHAGAFMPKDPITDRQLVQLICAYRLLDPEVEITISTREGREFRDHLMHLGATSMSAGSSTEPGGYVTPHKELEQFAINDDRTPEEMVAAIKAQGLEPVWKDWAPWM